MLRLLLLLAAFMQAYFNFIDLAGAFEVLGSDSTLNCCVFFLRRMKYLIAQLLRVVFATDEISDPECGKAQLSRRPGNMKNGRIGWNIESAGSPCFSCMQIAK